MQTQPNWYGSLKSQEPYNPDQYRNCFDHTFIASLDDNTETIARGTTHKGALSGTGLSSFATQGGSE